MAQDKQAELEQLFEKLTSLAANEQHEKALKVADAILKAAPGDVDACKCKAMAYIQLGDFDAAMQMLNNKVLASTMQYERAYCLYRLQRFEEALQLAEGLPAEMEAAGLELQAQLHYRLRNSQQCIQAYETLIQQRKVTTLELKTNVLAAYVSASLAAQLPALMASLKITPKQSYEIGYNRACGLVEQGELAEAETALRMAIKQGEEALYEEDFTEEEVLDELAPLSVQLAYVLGRLGRPQEAIARLEPLVNGQLSDEAAAALAANNAFVEGSAADGQQRGLMARSLKKLDALLAKGGDPLTLTPALEGRLAAKQKLAIHLNRALLAMAAGKFEQARQVAGLLAKAYAGEPLVVLLQAALLAREGKAADADKLLSSLPTATTQPDSSTDGHQCTAPPSLYPALLRMQLALEGGDAKRALAVLQSLDKGLQMRPGMLATRVALHEQLGEAAAAESVLEAGLSHWQQQQQAGPRGTAGEAAEGVGWCLQRLVALKLAAGKPAEATKLYQQLPPGGAGEVGGPAVLAKLARAAAASGDTASIAALSKDVPGASGKGKGAGPAYDLEALEGFSKAVVKRREDRKRDAEEPAEQQPKTKRAKKKRKPRLPKGYDPTKPNGGLPPPDPERWLPKWQRSDAKKKQTRRQRERTENTVKGSQGAGKVNEALDRTKASAGDGETKGSPSKPALPQRPKGKGRR